MESTLLGNTGRRVSRLGFGGAPAGLKDYIASYDPEDTAQFDGVVAAVRRAVDLGITYFDTAPAYGDGTGERVFGEALNGIPADDIFLATKCLPCPAAEVRQSLEQSLPRLRRDRIDLLQVHGTVADEQIDTVLGRGGMLDEMVKMRDEGLVKPEQFIDKPIDPELVISKVKELIGDP